MCANCRCALQPTAVYPEGTITGYFGPLTQQAVQRFQARHEIVASGTPETTGYGVVGPLTGGAIAVCAAGRATLN
jgi:peptidoglycan hydrolase-like protein with peptidoglycan-binding domain